MIVYQRITSLSDLQTIKFQKGKKSFETTMPTLSALPFVFTSMLPHLQPIEKEILMRKIQLIHSTNQNIATG